MPRFQHDFLEPHLLRQPSPTMANDDSAIDSGSESEDHARDHYVEVGKSKLRKRDGVPLGPQYKGSRVSREDAFNEDSDDPLERDFGEDEVDEGSDDQREVNTRRLNGGAHDTYGSDTSGSEDDGSDELDGDESDSMEDETEDDDDEDGFGQSGEEDGIDRAELRRIMAQDQKNVAATISQAAKADVEKGKAVKNQRSTFDTLLNVRIRLQKALIATNSLAAPDAAEFDEEKGTETMRAAETAAFSLWNSLNEFRSSLEASRTGSKRKHTEFSIDSTADELWSHMKSYDSTARPHRQAVLNKWSAKARGATAALTSTRGRLNNTKEQTLSDVLNGQLLDKDRLVKRTRTPRSCAPVQAKSGGAESPHIYDDADFYGLLLKELLERRSDSASAAGAGFNFSAPWQAVRDAKTKKVVDTKASKGRKLRYTVHEKLQNFMAPEDRGRWGERQVDELFGSLFGRRMALGEERESSGDEDEIEADALQGAEGLMLFRS
ncbi:TRAUB-domain-containing protein [Rhizodiscina lignyota]|uniref:Protein BFR2 n=1 Tax=Rhizodiscina lignyota TaxID=1504668 RepID=A0A9P4IFJ4_9PEZI|nr:TRAUB-domain-containing protein [Rhizodiscina lignyota]